MKAVIFDMDGVLVDSEQHWVHVETEFLQGFVPGWTDRMQKSILGMSAFDVHRLLVEKHAVSISSDEFLERYQDLANDIYGVKSSLIEGTIDLAGRLKESGLPLAIASSSPRAWVSIVVERFTLDRFFSATSCSDDVGGKGKPAPDVYLHAAEQLKVEPKHCIAIEDTSKGLSSARAAGMATIALRNGFNDEQDLSQADLLVSTLAETSLAQLNELR
jgi:HAD superfamily hydrolase (TIGR01509 family)